MFNLSYFIYFLLLLLFLIIIISYFLILYIGGMCACRCSGSTAVKYGSMRENVLNVTAVLPNGTIIKTGLINIIIILLYILSCYIYLSISRFKSKKIFSWL
jgi:hypothetical protein